MVVPLCYVTYAVEGALQAPGSASSVRALRLLRLLRVGRAIGRLAKIFGKLITSTRKTKVFMNTMVRHPPRLEPASGSIFGAERSPHVRVCAPRCHLVDRRASGR